MRAKPSSIVKSDRAGDVKVSRKAQFTYLFVITPPAVVAKDTNFSGAYPSIQLAPTEPYL